jgi:hypothetical protein
MSAQYEKRAGRKMDRENRRRVLGKCRKVSSFPSNFSMLPAARFLMVLWSTPCKVHSDNVGSSLLRAKNTPDPCWRHVNNHAFSVQLGNISQIISPPWMHSPKLTTNAKGAHREQIDRSPFLAWAVAHPAMCIPRSCDNPSAGTFGFDRANLSSFGLPL